MNKHVVGMIAVLGLGGAMASAPAFAQTKSAPVDTHSQKSGGPEHQMPAQPPALGHFRESGPSEDGTR